MPTALPRIGVKLGAAQLVDGMRRKFYMRYSRLQMPSWWGGRMKALRRIPRKDIVDAVVVSVFLLVLSALMMVPMVATI